MYISYGVVIPVKLLRFEIMTIKYVVFMILNKYFYCCNYKKSNDKEIWTFEITHTHTRMHAFSLARTHRERERNKGFIVILEHAL